MIVALLVFSSEGAFAQFGLKCDAPSFAQSLADAKVSVDVEAAIRATCAFNKKNAEIREVFGKSGWSWDLLPKAQADIVELTELADRAATLNFATRDPRGLGNIRNMYVRVGDQKRWLAGEEQKFAKHQQALAARNAGDVTQTGPSQTGAAFVSVIFQDNISTDDRASFLSAYEASIVGGPAADGSYRLKLETPPPQDQLPLVLNSMNSQRRVVKSAFAP